MKNQILILLLSLILSFYSCEKAQKDNIVYKNGDKKVEFKILNGNDYLEYDKSIKTEFILTNINPNTFNFVGVGMKLTGIENQILKTEIKVPSNYLKTDTLKIKAVFGNKQKTFFKFNIPIK